jgi:hypothetical protein
MCWPCVLEASSAMEITTPPCNRCTKDANLTSTKCMECAAYSHFHCRYHLDPGYSPDSPDAQFVCWPCLLIRSQRQMTHKMMMSMSKMSNRMRNLMQMKMVSPMTSYLRLKVCSPMMMNLLASRD